MLDPKTLGTEIYTELKKLKITSESINEDQSDPEKIWQAIAKKITDHIIKNAEVTVEGVQSGPGSAIGKIK